MSLHNCFNSHFVCQQSTLNWLSQLLELLSDETYKAFLYSYLQSPCTARPAPCKAHVPPWPGCKVTDDVGGLKLFTLMLYWRKKKKAKLPKSWFNDFKGGTASVDHVLRIMTIQIVYKNWKQNSASDRTGLESHCCGMPIVLKVLFKWWNRKCF